MRIQFQRNPTFRESTRQHDLKPFLIVLHQKNYVFNSSYMALKTVLSEDKSIDYRKVFNTDELRLRICSYL